MLTNILFQLIGTLVRRAANKTLSGLLQHRAHPPPPPVHLVQLLPTHLRHLVGDQPALPDHDVCLRRVSLYEDGATDDTSEHGRGWSQVRPVTLPYLLSPSSLLHLPPAIAGQICDSFIIDNILIKLPSYVITSL